MSKVCLGVGSTLLLSLGVVFWLYTSALESMGELEQANNQYVATIESFENQIQERAKQQQFDSELSLSHHEKALKILRDEMSAKENYFSYRENKLRLEIKRLKATSIQTVNISKDVVDEEINKEDSDKCAELPIPESYLKQL